MEAEVGGSDQPDPGKWDHVLRQAAKGHSGAQRILDLIAEVMDTVGTNPHGHCMRERWRDYQAAWEGCVEAQRKIRPGQRVVVIDSTSPEAPEVHVGIVVPPPDIWPRVAGLFPWARMVRVWDAEDGPPGGRNRYAHVVSMIPITREAYTETRRGDATRLQREMDKFLDLIARTGNQEVD